MRSYDVALTALAINAPLKWTDNVLSQHTVPDVVSARRGVSRRVAYAAVLRLAIVRELHVGLGVGVSDALALAARMLEPGGDGVYSAGALSIRIDMALIERRLGQRLTDAMESAPSPRRGRPPGRRAT